MFETQETLFDNILQALGQPRKADRAGLLHPFYNAQTGSIQLYRSDSQHPFTLDNSMQVQLGLKLNTTHPLSHAEFGAYQPVLGLAHRLALILIVNDPLLPLRHEELVRAVGRTFYWRFMGMDNDPIRSLAGALIRPDEMGTFPVDLRALTLEVEYRHHVCH